MLRFGSVRTISMSSYQFTAIGLTGKKKDVIITGEAVDDYFGKHQYGYKIDGEKNTLSQKTFNRRFTVTHSDEDQQRVADLLDTVKEEPLADIQARTFIVTDACQWEANKEGGAYHPHAIEVVDVETGQVRMIASGAKIKFVEGGITSSRTQDEYNQMKE
jgi:hypothetical protein